MFAVNQNIIINLAKDCVKTDWEMAGWELCGKRIPYYQYIRNQAKKYAAYPDDYIDNEFPNLDDVIVENFPNSELIELYLIRTLKEAIVDFIFSEWQKYMQQQTDNYIAGQYVLKGEKK